ncbi:chondroitinase family polysaccharide lyase [Pontiella sulfatireligans]|uniref:Chondroitin sulfate ABC endolyase n=1 Tax=Pontiella sulfatireligans TaxID=2750658 RepID=A0A6C2UFY1_9BACT|nr:chondroitinase family polysaccharide lyase [Pontiella sulfatireligans]VGO19065.1 Chondroitin sulfate ABC endolyase [Pontiella sulfatireligans]
MKLTNTLYLAVLIGLLGRQDAGASSRPMDLLRATSFERAADLDHFQAEEPSAVEMSRLHSQFGMQSLCWKCDSANVLVAKNIRPLSGSDGQAGEAKSHFLSSPTFVFSIYNPEAQVEPLRVEFGDGDGFPIHFDFQLNFTGWRTAWVPFYEMEGAVPEAGAGVQFSTMRFIAPASTSKLFLDDIIFASYLDNRLAYPDFQVPFIKKNRITKLSGGMWVPKQVNLDLLAQAASKRVAPEIQAEMDLIYDRLFNNSMGGKVKSRSPSYFQEKFSDLGIGDRGMPLRYVKQVSDVCYDLIFDGTPEYLDMRSFGTLLLELARSYHSCDQSADKALLEKLFITAMQYSLEQGWQTGSVHGTFHHIGYWMKNFDTALFLMRDVLMENNLLESVGDAMQWRLNLGEVFVSAEKLRANIDYYNTQATFCLMSVFMESDTGRQATLLEAYARSLTSTLAMTGESGMFKEDGTVWHHKGHYPAYGNGAFAKLPDILQAFSGTSFRIGTAGHANLKKAMMAATIYSNPTCWGLGQAGRHPLGGNIDGLSKAYLQLARSGSPDGTERLDREVAAAYLRIWGEPKDAKTRQLFAQQAITKVDAPSGHWTFPYAAMSVHRRADWSVNLKGYNQYVWASEIYVLNNRYGRYQSNGLVQIMPNKSKRESGYVEQGWDWNHPPGATTIELPYEELEPKKDLVMFKSAETFAGGCALDGDGVWAMKLNEADGFTVDPVKEEMSFPGKLKARKSVHCFRDRLLCLGSNIESVDREHPVHTTLFQAFLESPANELQISGEPSISEFPYRTEIKNGKSTWIIDPIGNAYRMLEPSRLLVAKREQTAPHNRYSIWTGKDNNLKGDRIQSGDFAIAWIDHGVAPQGEGYAYLVYPQVGSVNIETLEERFGSDAALQIERKDDRGHIVSDPALKLTSYACFEGGILDDALLKSVSIPCFVMAKEDGNQLSLAVSNPDLNAPLGDKTGWFSGDLEMSTVVLVLEGSWGGLASDKVKFVQQGTQTELTVDCMHGLPTTVALARHEINNKK